MSYENNTDATTNNNNIQVDWEVVVVISHNDTSGGVLTEDMDDIGEHIYHASEYDPTNDMVHLYQLDDKFIDAQYSICNIIYFNIFNSRVS